LKNSEILVVPLLTILYFRNARLKITQVVFDVGVTSLLRKCKYMENENSMETYIRSGRSIDCVFDTSDLRRVFAQCFVYASNFSLILSNVFC
jgi:hypothetical protein